MVVIIAAGLILLLESMQQLNKWQENSILYRLTCEGLRNEQHLYNEKPGPTPRLGRAGRRARLGRALEMGGGRQREGPRPRRGVAGAIRGVQNAPPRNGVPSRERIAANHPRKPTAAAGGTSTRS
jgi:hypothetical protein